MTQQDAAISTAAEPLSRPQCFEFAMDFLGEPETSAVRQYVEALEAATAASQPIQPADTSAEAVAQKPWYREGVTLTARQLRNALDFVAPDFDTDEDQRESEVGIAFAPLGLCQADGEPPEPAGYRVWLSEYPEEGSALLVDEYEVRAPPTAAAQPPALTEAQIAEVMRLAMHIAYVYSFGGDMSVSSAKDDLTAYLRSLGAGQKEGA